MRRFNHLILRRQKAFAEAVLRGESREQMLGDSEWRSAADRFGYCGSEGRWDYARQCAFKEDFEYTMDRLNASCSALPGHTYPERRRRPLRRFELDDLFTEVDALESWNAKFSSTTNASNNDSAAVSDVRLRLINELAAGLDANDVDYVLDCHIQRLDSEIRSEREAFERALSDFMAAEFVPISLAFAFLEKEDLRAAMELLDGPDPLYQLARADRALSKLRNVLKSESTRGRNLGEEQGPMPIPISEWDTPMDGDRLELRPHAVIQNKVESKTGRKQFDQVQVSASAISNWERAAQKSPYRETLAAAQTIGDSLKAEHKKITRQALEDRLEPLMRRLSQKDRDRLWCEFRDDYVDVVHKGRPPKAGD
jgi:hypothetical protein